MTTAIVSSKCASSTPRVAQRVLAVVRDAYHAGLPAHRLRRYIGAAANIRTYTLARERLCLFDEATAVLAHPNATGRIVEIGSYLGASAAVLAEALRRERAADKGRLFCIDTWQNDAMTEGHYDTFAAFQSNVTPWAALITPIREQSSSAPFSGTLPLDLAFIDGDHSYEAARDDIARFAPLIAAHGRLVLHDHRSKPGVARALGELLMGGQWVIHCCVESLVSLKRAPWVHGDHAA